MNLESYILEPVQDAVRTLYGAALSREQFQLQATRKEFEGDITLVCFPIAKISRKNPEQTGREIGAWLQEHCRSICRFNVIKGFLNLKLSSAYWSERLHAIADDPLYGRGKPTGKTFMIEFSSPNTNKPLHLGHIRNNLLGWSVSRLMEANGNKVIKVNIVNDRGIHICKSMLAWQKWGGGQTPQSTGQKGDHLVGDYYVLFDKEYKRQIAGLMETQSLSREEAEKQAPVIREAQRMLLAWEQGDASVRKLWETMNAWVYEGFDQTYRRLGVSFDKIYYESQTYLLGKKYVQQGLDAGVFYRRADGSVWCDLRQEGLDEKLLLRSDGTSVYMTQDIGTAQQRYEESRFDRMIYVVGNEQNYHFQVLKLILAKLGFAWSDHIYHLSYGMVELPEGKMKSREGTVVDADDLMDDMVATARETSMESGKLDDMDPDEQEKLFQTLGLGALKYFILKVDPQKTMLFDPKESIDFNGNTGPFIQYTHARICSILRKARQAGCVPALWGKGLLDKEERIVKLMSAYPDLIVQAGKEISPALIANFAFDLAKEFNQYYHEVSVLKEENEHLRDQRLVLIEQVAKLLRSSMDILGIELPERM